MKRQLSGSNVVSVQLPTDKLQMKLPQKRLKTASPSKEKLLKKNTEVLATETKKMYFQATVSKQV